MLKILSKRGIGITSVCMILILCIAFSMFGMKSFAEMVVVEESKSPVTDLQFISIQSGNHYKSKNSFNQNGSEYTIETNSYSAWEDKDDVDFAYKRLGFNYGKTSKVTVETTVKSWNGTYTAASAGILLRSSLAPGAASVFLNARPEGIYLLYRYADNAAYTKGQTLYSDIGADCYPVQLKVELQNNYATASYKTAKDAKWKKFTSAAPCIISTGEVYVGVAAHSCIEANYEKAVFDDFNYIVEAEEGYSPTDPVEPEIKEDNLIVEDSKVTQDTLMRETFSDNSIFDGEETVENPIWSTNVVTPEILTDDERTNRCLLLDYLNRNSYYLAGDRTWTDYTLSLDVTFPENILPLSANKFYVFTRMQDIDQYGYQSYVLEFITIINERNPEQSRQVLRLGRLHNSNKIVSTDIDKKIEWLVTTDFNYLDNLGTTNVVRLDAIDNTVRVFYNGEEIKELAITDTSNQMKLIGAVGFGGEDVSVRIDNVTVRRLEDPLGGDYDNKIGGRFDQPIPNYIKEYAENKWSY